MLDDANGTEVMEDGVNAGTESVGAGLRAMRERLGWKLPDVAEALRIRPEFIAAIEAGDLAALPGPAYRAGFVRSYASRLGLDPDEILRRLRAEGGLRGVANTDTRFITPVPDGGLPKGAAVLLGVVVLLAGYGIWYFYSNTQRRMAEQVAPVPAELAPLATPPKVNIAPVASPAPAAAAPNAAVPGAAVPNAAEPSAATPSAAVSNAAVPASAAAAQPGSTPAAAPPATTAPAQGAGLVIAATQDAWIEVKDAAGNILFSKVLHPGDSWPVPQESGLTLTTGNAGGTELVTDGKAGPPLGAQGAVVHDIPLGQAAPAAAPDQSPPSQTVPSQTAPSQAAPNGAP